LKLSTISKKLNLKLIGDPDYDVYFICSINLPKKNSITYITDRKFLKKNITSKLDVILLDEKNADFAPENANLLISKNIYLSVFEITHLFKRYSKPLVAHEKLKSYPSLINSGKFLLGEDVSIGLNCKFGSNVVIEDNVTIGDNVNLGHNVVICTNCIIGNNVTIEHGSVIGSEGFGNNRLQDGSWIHVNHVGSVLIADNVSIGSNCSIDRGTIDNTIIGKGVIIDNLVHIAHNVVIGDNTAIAAKVGIAGSCQIGKRNMIGGMVGIVDHIKTADDVIISATSTINKDIKEPGTYTGIMPISNHANWKRIAFWITKLDKIAKVLKLKKI